MATALRNPGRTVWLLRQRVSAHPKVAPLLTWYPIRRWRAIRRWPPVVMAEMFADDISGRVHHPDWLLKVAIVALHLAGFAVVLAADAYLMRRARRRSGERSRLAYLVIGLGLLSIAGGTVLAGLRYFPADNTWPADVLDLITELSAWAAILALGRALTWGRYRRLFWVYPPVRRPAAGASRDTATTSASR